MLLLLEHGMISDELAERFDFKIEVVERKSGTSRMPAPQNYPAICYQPASAVSPLQSSPVATRSLQDLSHEPVAMHSGLTPPPAPHMTPSRQPTPSPASMVGAPISGLSSPVSSAQGVGGLLFLDDDDREVDAALLQSIGVREEHILGKFQDEGINTVGVLKLLNMQDLQKLGFNLGTRKRILHALGESK